LDKTNLSQPITKQCLSRNSN